MAGKHRPRSRTLATHELMPRPPAYAATCWRVRPRRASLRAGLGGPADGGRQALRACRGQIPRAGAKVPGVRRRPGANERGRPSHGNRPVHGSRGPPLPERSTPRRRTRSDARGDDLTEVPALPQRPRALTRPGVHLRGVQVRGIVPATAHEPHRRAPALPQLASGYECSLHGRCRPLPDSRSA